MHNLQTRTQLLRSENTYIQKVHVKFDMYEYIHIHYAYSYIKIYYYYYNECNNQIIIIHLVSLNHPTATKRIHCHHSYREQITKSHASIWLYDNNNKIHLSVCYDWVNNFLANLKVVSQEWHDAFGKKGPFHFYSAIYIAKQMFVCHVANWHGSINHGRVSGRRNRGVHDVCSPVLRKKTWEFVFYFATFIFAKKSYNNLYKKNLLHWLKDKIIV